MSTRNPHPQRSSRRAAALAWAPSNDPEYVPPVLSDLHEECRDVDPSVEKLRNILKKSPEKLVLEEDVQKQLPLHWVCQGKSLEALRLLLEHKPEEQIFHVSNIHQLPLHLAANAKVAEILLQIRPEEQVVKGSIMRQSFEEYAFTRVECHWGGLARKGNWM